MSLEGRGGNTEAGAIKIAVPRLARIANFDDFDPLIAEPEVTLVSVTSNEGSARVDDIRDAERGSDDRELRLRAARDGKGDGRVYTIVYRVTDRAGNSADAVTEVRVPHDRGR